MVLQIRIQVNHIYLVLEHFIQVAKWNRIVKTDSESGYGYKALDK